MQIRTRECNDPSPKYGGANCQGLAKEGSIMTCNEGQCPIDGNWGPWVRSCSNSCGNGYLSRTRVCNDPPPQFGGADCEGPSSAGMTFEGCNEGPCPVGSWGRWGHWTICSAVLCGGGTRLRRRDCNGGVNCPGGTRLERMGIEKLRCNTEECPGADLIFLIFLNLTIGKSNINI